jgi:hypothetical protein
MQTVTRFMRPRLSNTRICVALLAAILTDSLQFFLGPFGWLWVDQALDVLAMLLTVGALGFHILLLPTFIVELFPVVDALPTWTGCTLAVIMLRKATLAKEDARADVNSNHPSPPIEVSAEVTHIPPKL